MRPVTLKRLRHSLSRADIHPICIIRMFFTCKDPASQPVSLALAMCSDILKGKGAYRVHGGGFAGTIQAFVPADALDEFKSKICAVFGERSCYVLNIRPEGGVQLV